MKNRLVTRTILAAACILCTAAAFPQTLKSPKRKRVNPVPTTATKDIDSKTYVVKQGDTLCHVAAANGTTVSALQTANQLRGTLLKVGQKLVIPVPKEQAAYRARKPAPPAPKQAEAVPAEADDSAPDEAPAAGLAAQAKPAVAQGDDIAAQPVRYRLASLGLDFLGVRYRRSGDSVASGFDCSGLVKALFEKFQITLPHSSREQFKEGQKVGLDDLEVGDLVFFSPRGSRGKTPNHVGIYIGENQFLHAAIKAKRVLISNLTKPWYVQRFLGARRFPDLWKDEPKAADGKTADTKSN